jgi:hypothetical protein
MTSSTPMRCKCRKQAVTGLRCSRCFVPICPDCSRPAPVGMLCRDCARGKPSHLYVVEPKNLAAAIPVTLLAGLFGGWLMSTIRGIGFFGMFAGFLYGLAVGEVALRMTGRKRGLQIEILAGVCVLIGLIGGYAFQLFVATSITGAHGSPLDLVEPIEPAAMALRLLLDPWMYVTIVVSVFAAVSRVRNVG